MKTARFLVLLLPIALLVFGCAKKKEEAAKLEQEMMDDRATDSIAADSIHDAKALPPEETVDVAADVTPPTPVSGEGHEFELDQTAGEGYAVQVAACPSMTYAQQLARKYVARGYDPYVTTAVVEGVTYYRVRLGPLENRSEADRLKAELDDKYSVTAWIDHRSQ